MAQHFLTAEKNYLIDFTENSKKFCLSLHYDGGNSYLLVSWTESITFNVKGSEIVTTPFCLGNNLKEFSINNMKKKQD